MASEPVDYEAERLRLLANIEMDRARLDAAVQEVKVAAKQKVDLARHISRHPYHFLGGALLLGFWVGYRD